MRKGSTAQMMFDPLSLCTLCPPLVSFVITFFFLPQRTQSRRRKEHKEIILTHQQKLSNIPPMPGPNLLSLTKIY